MTKQYTAITGAAVSAPDKAYKFITGLLPRYDDLKAAFAASEL